MNLIGKRLSELSPEELKQLVIFLDIDETIGKAISVSQNEVDETVQTELYDGDQSRYRLLYTSHLYGTVYSFSYYKNAGIRWIKVDITFEFRESFDALLDFFVIQSISEVYFLSAAVEEYIEGIIHIIKKFYGFSIKGYVSISDTQQRNILVDSKVVLYMEKDMIFAMNKLFIMPDKIPILLDDRPYWAKNGYVIPIRQDIDRISVYINTPIEESKAPLFIIYEEVDRKREEEAIRAESAFV
jgi:hypothetical protein